MQTLSKFGLSEEDIWTKYAELFQHLGEFGEPLHLEVDETIKPVQIPPRGIPKALRTSLKNHLSNRLSVHNSSKQEKQ